MFINNSMKNRTACLKLSVIFGRTLTIMGFLNMAFEKTLDNLNACVPNVGNFNIFRQLWEVFLAALDLAPPLQFMTELLYGQNNIGQKQVITQIAVAHSNIIFKRSHSLLLLLLLLHSLVNSYLLQNFARMGFFLLSK